MSDEPTPQDEHDDDENRAPLQRDTFGFLLRVSEGAEDEPRPTSWKEVLSRTNKHLMTICERVFGVVADTLDGAGKLVRGIFDLPAAFADRVRGAHVQADKREQQIQSTGVEASSTPARLLSGPTPSDDSVSLEDKLREYQAKGFSVGLVRLPNGSWGCFVVRPSLTDRAEAFLLTDDSCLPVAARGKYAKLVRKIEELGVGQRYAPGSDKPSMSEIVDKATRPDTQGITVNPFGSDADSGTDFGKIWNLLRGLGIDSSKISFGFGPKSLVISGTVRTHDEKQRVLNIVRGLLPEGSEVVDHLAIVDTPS